MIIYEHKTLEYKGKPIFEKIIMGDFKRIPKYFHENEVCFMFVENGSFLMRTPEKTISFISGDGMLAKCGNYFFEKSKEVNRSSEEKTTVIGAFFTLRFYRNYSIRKNLIRCSKQIMMFVKSI